jgi:hypothetical protein
LTKSLSSFLLLGGFGKKPTSAWWFPAAGEAHLEVGFLTKPSHREMRAIIFSCAFDDIQKTPP